MIYLIIYATGALLTWAFLVLRRWWEPRLNDDTFIAIFVLLWPVFWAIASVMITKYLIKNRNRWLK